MFELSIIATYLFIAAIYITPLWIVLKRAGFSGAWAIMAIIPAANIVALWVFALCDWPATNKKGKP